MSNYVINLLSVVSLYLIIELSKWVGSLLWISRTTGELSQFGAISKLVFCVLFYVYLFTKLQSLFKEISLKIIK